MEEFLYSLDGGEERGAGRDIDGLLLVHAGIRRGDGGVEERTLGYFCICIMRQEEHASVRSAIGVLGGSRCSFFGLGLEMRC